MNDGETSGGPRGFDVRRLAGTRWPVPAWHHERIEAEMACQAPKDRLVAAEDDLHGFRGFYEPYKEEWLRFDPISFLEAAGFESVEPRDVAPPLWSAVARRPATT